MKSSFFFNNSQQKRKKAKLSIDNTKVGKCNKNFKNVIKNTIKLNIAVKYY